MKKKLFVFFLLLASCAGLPRGHSPWQYKSTDRAGIVAISSSGLRELIARAQRDFSASPAFPEHSLRNLHFLGAGRHSDGRTFIAFRIGYASDVSAIYVFNMRGEIEDKYLHSWWGAQSTTSSR